MKENQSKSVNSRYWLLLAVLVVGGVFINWFERRGEAETSRKPLAEIPNKLGLWQQKGDGMKFDPQTESVPYRFYRAVQR